MPRIQLIIQKDDGSEIKKLIHHFKSNETTFDGIEKEVESFKNKVLSEIEGELLKEAQDLFIQEEKKKT